MKNTLFRAEFIPLPHNHKNFFNLKNINFMENIFQSLEKVQQIDRQRKKEKIREKILSLIKQESIEIEINKSMIDSSIENENFSKSKNLQVRKRFSQKLLIYDYLNQLPEDFDPKQWLVASVPLGNVCLLYTSNSQTMIRDRAGYFVDKFPSLLPCGSEQSLEQKPCTLEIILDKENKQIFVIDLLTFNGRIFADDPFSFRQYWLQSKFAEIENLGKISEKYDFRLLSYNECTEDSLLFSYFGSKIHPSQLNSNYNLDLNLNCNLSSISLGFDLKGKPFIKNGISVINSNAIYVFGNSSQYLIWRDPNICSYFKDEYQCSRIKLFYSKKGTLETQDGYYLESDLINTNNIQKGCCHLFNFDKIVISEEKIFICGLRHIKEVKTRIADSLSRIEFKYRCIQGNNSNSFERLLESIKKCSEAEEDIQEMTDY